MGKQPIPEDLFRKVKLARTFHAGSQMLHYLNKAMADMELHDSKHDFKNNYGKPDLLEYMWERAKRVSSLTTGIAYGCPMQDYEARYLASFSHAFDGPSYAA